MKDAAGNTPLHLAALNGHTCEPHHMLFLSPADKERTTVKFRVHQERVLCGKYKRKGKVKPPVHDMFIFIQHLITVLCQPQACTTCLCCLCRFSNSPVCDLPVYHP